MRIPFAWRGRPSWCEFQSLWRGWPSWCESQSLGEGYAIDANSIRYWQGESFEANPSRCGEGIPLRRIPFSWRRGLPWSESHSLWIGEVPRGEYHSLGEGNPLERGGETPSRRILFAWRRLPWSENHSLWRGESLDVNVIHLIQFEKRATWTGWTPLWSEYYSHWGRGPPWCRAQSWASGVAAKRIWVAQVIPVKIPMSGEGNPLKRGPRLWLGESLATNQSEAFVRTATVTKMTAEVVPRTRTAWKGTEA